jgi:uncharacterized membrane protein (DUF373 family)
MVDYVRKFERAMTAILIVMMALVVVESVGGLVWTLFRDVIASPPILGVNDLLDVFGEFLLVLIGLELLETLKAYARETIIRAEVILLVAMIALSRKIITLELKYTTPAQLLGIAALLIALAVAYFLIRRTRKRERESSARILRITDDD